ncbi:MAG: acyl-CoA dehydrogenase family protein [Acidobacteria bacterium]|nr:acyl-CoA dehydrogenase family protein [Acidobacteriota bacterium]
MATTTFPIAKPKGGAFLLEQRQPHEVFTPEDFTDEHRAIGRATAEFFAKEVAPHLDTIQYEDKSVAVGIMRKSGELGLTGVIIPEKFGGMEMDLTSMMIVGENIAGDGSYAGWHAAHTGIGTLPILLFGTEEQKAKYLPKLASAEWVGAYCLSEPQAGSDALAIKTRAELSPDGKHYILNGQKMWITNGGYADLYTIFAKIDGEKFTAFIVERSFPGVQPGAEEKKMGIRGSSTTPIFLDNVKVPVENVLGEIGRGHIIAFNILNLGRLKLGPLAIGGCKDVIAIAAKYAKERKAFGKTISAFGMIQQKLAEMAIRTYIGESMSYRVVGMIESHLENFSWDAPDAAQTKLKAVEEYATESSYVKVFASEVLDFVVDEGVQIHGGYGFHQDYAVERAYRDSRINRIFEGTNEINRLLATGMLLKRAQRGALPLVQAVMKLQNELLSPPELNLGGPVGPFVAETKLVENAKKIGLMTLGIAFQKYMTTIDEQQELLASITDIMMNAFAMESGLLRAQKIAASGKNAQNATEMAAVFCREAMDSIEAAAKVALANCQEGDALRMSLAVLKRFAKYEPIDAIKLRRNIAARVLETGKYTV